MGGDLVEFPLLFYFSWGFSGILVVSVGGVNSTRYCFLGVTRVDVTLRSFLSLFRTIRQYLRACSSSGILVWVETMASPAAAGVAKPPLLSAIVFQTRGP